MTIRGKHVSEMTREELIEALESLAEQLQQQQAQYMRDLNTLIP